MYWKTAIFIIVFIWYFYRVHGELATRVVGTPHVGRVVSFENVSGDDYLLQVEFEPREDDKKILRRQVDRKTYNKFSSLTQLTVCYSPYFEKDAILMDIDGNKFWIEFSLAFILFFAAGFRIFRRD